MDAEQRRYLDLKNKADNMANAIRYLSEALAFHQQTRTASDEERVAVGSDGLEWLRQASTIAVEAAADAGYPVRGRV